MRSVSEAAAAHRPVRPHSRSRTPTRTPSRPGVLRWVWRWRYAFALATAAAYVAGFSGHWRPTPDGARFVNLARAIETGGPDITGLGAPNHTPPGLPRVIAWLTEPADFYDHAGRVTALHGFMYACVAAVLLLTLLTARRALGPRRGAAVTLAVAGSALFFGHATGMATELPFTVGLMLVLYGDERRHAAPGPGGRGRTRHRATAAVCVTLGFAVMFLFRSVAAVYAAAYVAALLIETARWRGRRFNRVRAARAVLSGAAVAGAAAVVLRLSPAVRADAVLLWHHVTEPQLRRAAPGNLLTLFTEHTGAAVTGFDLDAFSSAAVGVLAFGGVLVWFRRRPFWAVLLVACVVQWTCFLPLVRYLMPLVPLLVIGVGTAVAGLTRRLPAGRRHAARSLALVLLVGPNTVKNVDTILERRRTGGPVVAGIADYDRTFEGGKFLAQRRAAHVVHAAVPPGAKVSVPWELYRETFSAFVGRPVRFRRHADATDGWRLKSDRADGWSVHPPDPTAR